MRLADPAVAAEWRLAVREVLGESMAAGGTVAGFTRDGWYVVEQDSDQGRENAP